MTYDKDSIVFEPLPTHFNFKDVTGKVYGRLTVLGLIARGSHNRPIWLCQCECGQSTRTATSDLVSGRTKSCGCWRRDTRGISKRTHGRSKSQIYDIWVQMCGRCHNPRNKGFANYGGRGIQVCDRWRHSFENFLLDMGDRPASAQKRAEYSIERKDNNGDYCPENCIWATLDAQRNNTRRAHLITFQGKTQSLKLWCDELHLNYSTIRSRVNESGWSDEKALTTPVKPKRSS